MVPTSAFIFAVSLAISALGALPPSGAPYRILNVQTKVVFDNDEARTVPGNPIRGIFVNNVPVGPQAQRIAIKNTGPIVGSTTAALYEFEFPMTGVSVFVQGPPAAGSALNVQDFSTQFEVTAVSSDVYTISFPFTNFAVESPPEERGAITLQPLNASNPLQQWKFVPDLV